MIAAIFYSPEKEERERETCFWLSAPADAYAAINHQTLEGLKPPKAVLALSEWK